MSNNNNGKKGFLIGLITALVSVVISGGFGKHKTKEEKDDPVTQPPLIEPVKKDKNDDIVKLEEDDDKKNVDINMGFNTNNDKDEDKGGADGEKLDNDPDDTRPSINQLPAVKPSDVIEPPKKPEEDEDDKDKQGNTKPEENPAESLTEPVIDTTKEETTVNIPKTENATEKTETPDKINDLIFDEDIVMPYDSSRIEYLYVTASTLNVRLGPSTNTEIVGVLHYGDTVARYNQLGDWSMIIYDDGYVYVYSDYLAYKEDKDEDTPIKPSTEKKIRTYTKGQHVQLSKNFNSDEFACKCSRCNTFQVDDRLVDYCQAIRDHFGVEINVNSGFRCEEHNREVGGASQSLHKSGRAADLSSRYVTPLELAQYAEKLGIKGVGLYSWGIHIDTRDTKYYWDNRNGVVQKNTFGTNTLKPDVVVNTPSNNSTNSKIEAPQIVQQWGVDVSRWQGYFDMSEAVSEGVKFAVIKGAGGDSGLYKDSKFEYNYSNAKSENIPVGAYFYSRALTTEQARQEAEYFYNNCLKGKQFELPVYMDVEDSKMLNLGKDNLTAIIKTFCDYLQEKGYVVGVYSSLYYFNTYMNDDQLQNYEHWVACWANSCNYKYKDNLGMWQFGGETNTQRSTIVAGQVTDQNWLFKDYPTIIKANHKNGF